MFVGFGFAVAKNKNAYTFQLKRQGVLVEMYRRFFIDIKLLYFFQFAQLGEDSWV